MALLPTVQENSETIFSAKMVLAEKLRSAGIPADAEEGLFALVDKVISSGVGTGNTGPRVRRIFTPPASSGLFCMKWDYSLASCFSSFSLLPYAPPTMAVTNSRNLAVDYKPFPLNHVRKAILVGGNYTFFFLTDDRKVLSCGDRYASVGLTTTKIDMLPIENVVDVVGSDTSIITASFIRTENGDVYSCGSNYSQLAKPVSSDPKWANLYKFVNLDGLRQVAFGGKSAYYLREDGKLLSCGDNANGQLGAVMPNGTSTALNIDEIAGLSNVKQVACGANYLAVLMNDGTVWNCGNNQYGQLGRNEASGSITTANLKQLTTISDVKKIVCGQYHTYFLKENGTVWNCGYNQYGQLGRAASNGSATVVNLAQLTTVSDITDIICGDDCTWFVKSDGTILNCGNNTYGQLGRNQTNGSISAVNLNTFTTIDQVVQIACGQYHTWLLKEDGTVWTCGNNSYGQLGRNQANGTTTSVNLAQLETIEDVKQIACGQSHGVCLKWDGTAYTAGYNTNGQLGRAIPNGAASSVNFGQVPLPVEIESIGAGSLNTVFFQDGNHVLNCGDNSLGQLARPSVSVGSASTSNLDMILSIHNIKQMAVGIYQAVLMKEDGTVIIGGHNSYGELCRTTTTVNGSPEGNLGVVWALSDVEQVTLSRNTVFFLKGDKTVWSAGYNSVGQLGRAVPTGSNSVVNLGPIEELEDVEEVVCPPGGYSTYFLKSDKSVWSCGDNSVGQLGRAVPTGSATFCNLGPIMNLSEVKGIFPAGSHVHFLMENGTVQNCGNHGSVGYSGLTQGEGTSGWLGRAIHSGTESFVNLGQIPGLYGVRDIAALSGDTFFLRENGELFSCGCSIALLGKPGAPDSFVFGSERSNLSQVLWI